MNKMQRYAVVSIATILTVAALRAAAPLLVPLVFGLVIALTFAPMVRRLEKLIPRWIAAALVVLTVVAGIGGFAYSMTDEAAVAIANLPAPRL